MEEVDLRIVLGRRGDRRPAESDHLACEAREVENLPALDVHARHEYCIGPGELALRHGADVLVDELDLPFPWYERREEEDPLGRHEGLDGAHQGKGVIEGAEGLRVGGKDAKDPPDIRRAEYPYVDRRSEERGRH